MKSISISRRERLPQRRRPIDLEHRGARYHGTIGFFPDSRLGEVFLNAEKANSALDGFAADAAVVISLALQHGVPIQDLRHSIKRDGRGEPHSVIGELLDKIGEVGR